MYRYLSWLDDATQYDIIVTLAVWVFASVLVAIFLHDDLGVKLW